jgi:DNA replication protein DnaC
VHSRTCSVSALTWNEVLRDAICDRVVHHAHRIELNGDSMRKVRAKLVPEEG